MKKEKDYTLLLFLLILIIILIISGFSYHHFCEPFLDKDFAKNILVELTSIIIEFAILGVLLIYLQNKKYKKELIDKLKNEIDYIRLLKTIESKYKIYGLIKQLSKLDISDIDLKQCDLSELKEFSGINLSNSILHSTSFEKSICKVTLFNESRGERTNFSGANLSGAQFKKSKFKRAIFNSSICKSVTFKMSEISDTQFNGSNLYGAKFINSELKNCTFINADLRKVDFTGATIIDVDFTNANVKGANFTKCKNFDSNQLNSAINVELIEK